MLTNLPLRVESDPMRVPRAASMSTGRSDTFESVLQEAVDADPDAAEPAAEVAAETVEAEVPAEQAPAEDQAAEARPERTEAEVATGEAFQPDGRESIVREQVAARTDATETMRRGGPERQAIAGKGTDSPRTSSPTPGLIAAVVVHGAVPAGNGPIAASASPAVQAVGAAKAGQALTPGVAVEWQRNGAPLRAPAAAAGYRTSGAASVQLLEQARDSVFKQILMKLNPEGGEMSLRLQPPELGELDLHLVVEGGNKLSLSIGAERADLAQVIQRHLDELKQTLERSGLQVTDAQVHTRGDGSRGDREHAARHDGSSRGDEPQRPHHIRPRSGGYVTAEGLDFWV